MWRLYPKAHLEEGSKSGDQIDQHASWRYMDSCICNSERLSRILITWKAETTRLDHLKGWNHSQFFIHDYSSPSRWPGLACIPTSMTARLHHDGRALAMMHKGRALCPGRQGLELHLSHTGSSLSDSNSILISHVCSSIFTFLKS